MPWLQRLVLRAADVRAAQPTGWRRWSAGCWCARSEVLEGIPFGTLFELAAPDVLVPVGMRLVPGGVARAAGRAAGRHGRRHGRVSRLARARRFASPLTRWSPLELRVLGALTPAIAGQAAASSRQEPIAEPVEIENRPMGPMPLWGLRRSNPAG